MTRSTRALLLAPVLAVLVGLVPAAPAGAIRQDPPQTTSECDDLEDTEDEDVWQVALVYIHAVERCPGAAEATYWAGRLDGGRTYLWLAEAIDRSNESLDQIVVETFARAGIERAASTEERTAFHASLRATRSFTGVLATVLGSEEFADVHEVDEADLPNRRWLELVYAILLGRQPEQEAIAHYSSSHDMSTVAGRARVTTIILRSAEMRQLWTGQVYESILGRKAEPDDLAFWDGWLRTGRGQDRTLLMRSLVLSSPEAHALATATK